MSQKSMFISLRFRICHSMLPPLILLLLHSYIALMYDIV